jgi:hypothetical protein
MLWRAHGMNTLKGDNFAKTVEFAKTIGNTRSRRARACFAISQTMLRRTKRWSRMRPMS